MASEGVEAEGAVAQGGVAWGVVEARCRVEARQGGGPLAEGRSGGEADGVMVVVVGWIPSVPSAEGSAWGCAAGHGAERLEETVFVEAEDDGEDVVALSGLHLTSQGNLLVAELFQRGLNVRGSCNSYQACRRCRPQSGERLAPIDPSHPARSPCRPAIVARKILSRSVPPGIERLRGDFSGNCIRLPCDFLRQPYSVRA
jgi:hypothetical protein